MPGAWHDWIALLAANTGKGGTWAAVPIPLLIRGPIGVALLIWGAPRNQRWVVPIAAMLALPALWYGSLSMVLGVIPLTTPEERRRGWARLRAGPARVGAGAAGVARHRPRRPGHRYGPAGLARVPRSPRLVSPM